MPTARSCLLLVLFQGPTYTADQCKGMIGCRSFATRAWLNSGPQVNITTV